LLAGLIAACAPDTTAPVLQPRPTQAVDSGEAEAVRIVALPTLPFEVAPFTDYACLDCHTDRALLEELARPIEKDDSHSEGPG
jgi:hypothetical protein